MIGHQELGRGLHNPDIAAKWDIHVTRADPFRKEVLFPYLVQRLTESGLSSGSQVLDVGCGQGISGEAVTELGAKVVGVDISYPLICLAHDHYKVSDRLRFSVADAAKLPFPTNQFTAGISINVLFHLNPEIMIRFFSELQRVVVPGGPVVITSVSPEAYLEFAGYFKNRKELEPFCDERLPKPSPAIVGDPEVPGPDGEPIILQDIPFIMHPPENIDAAVRSAGLSLMRWPPHRLGSLKLMGGVDKNLFIVYELIA